MSYKYEIFDNKSWLLNLKTNEYQEFNESKYFQNDIFDIDKNLIDSPVRNSKSLVGIFSTSQTQRFGKNKRGNVIYLVTPLDNELPSFLISYGGKTIGKIAVKFKFNNWDNKLPSGEIIEVIGNYNEENLHKILMYHYNIYPKNIKFDSNLNSNENNINRIKLAVNIFSIDPDDCEDIDDALSNEVK